LKSYQGGTGVTDPVMEKGEKTGIADRPDIDIKMKEGGADIRVAVAEEIGKRVTDLEDDEFKGHDPEDDQEVGLVIPENIVFKAGGARRLFL
jgi:hypothetical protein